MVTHVHRAKRTAATWHGTRLQQRWQQQLTNAVIVDANRREINSQSYCVRRKQDQKSEKKRAKRTGNCTAEVKRVKPGLERNLFSKGKQIYATEWLNTITNTCVNTIFCVCTGKKWHTCHSKYCRYLNIYERNRPTRPTNASP